MKKIVAIILVLCLAVALLACNKNSGGSNDSNLNSGDTGGSVSGSENNSGNDGNNPAAPKRDTLNIALTQDRGTLDPMYLLGHDFLYAINMIYEPLWKFDENNNQIWVLATGVDVIEPTKWHIHIREGVTFANGDKFDAYDVLFSFMRGNTRVGEPKFFNNLDEENTKVIDDYTLELIWLVHDMVHMSTVATMLMFDKDATDEATVATVTNGTGPYVVTDYVTNSHFNLTLRDDYWGEKPAIQNLSFKILSEDSQRVNAIQTGTVDIAAIPFQDISYVQGLQGINVDITPSLTTKSLYFNISPTSVFHDNVDARMAVAHAIEREGIVDIAYSGHVTPSRMPMSVANKDWEERFLDLGIYGEPDYGYNPTLAKELAEKSGLTSKTIKLINNGSSDEVVMCELIQANLKEIGVTVDVNNLDMGSWASILFDDTQYDMAIDFTSGPSGTLAQNLSAWYQYGGGMSYTYNSHPGDERYRALIDGIMAISDPKQLSDIYMQLFEIHAEAMLWYGLVDMINAYALNADLRGDAKLFGSAFDYSKFYWAS